MTQKPTKQLNIRLPAPLAEEYALYLLKTRQTQTAHLLKHIIQDIESTRRPTPRDRKEYDQLTHEQQDELFDNPVLGAGGVRYPSLPWFGENPFNNNVFQDVDKHGIPWKVE